MEENYLQRFVEETDWYNAIVLGPILPGWMWEVLPRLVLTWLRYYIGAIFLYFFSSILWCWYIYYFKKNVYVPQDAIPSKDVMIKQIIVSMKGTPWIVVPFTLSEYMIETGWTKCFSSISEIGFPLYIAFLAIYVVIVDFLMYWIHREMHDIKPLYRILHATHHIYNKQNTLSPFAGLALHPLDGILLSVPHVICLFIVPTHLMTHTLILFFDALYTTSIHDCIHGKVWLVMGAGYHATHHTTYRHNYGHYTICMDWMFRTLLHPEDDGKRA